MWPDFGKPTELLHFEIQEIAIGNIPPIVVSVCLIVAV